MRHLCAATVFLVTNAATAALGGIVVGINELVCPADPKDAVIARSCVAHLEQGHRVEFVALRMHFCIWPLGGVFGHHPGRVDVDLVDKMI